MAFRMSSIQFMTNYQASLNKAYQQQAKMLEQGDGQSIHRGSDDPIAYSKFMRYTTTANENEQYQRNVDTAISWMMTSDGAVAHMSERMQTLKEKAVAAANSYHTDADFQSIAKEMLAEIQQIVSVGNTQQGDRYVFAGQKDTTQPFVMSDGEYDRGLAKTLDAKQAAFFKGTSGNDTATLYQMLTLNYTNPETGYTSTYYLDTQSGYVYSKEFVDSGYKELIAQGYNTINDTDKLNTTTTIAKTSAIGTISTMTLEQAQTIVDNASEIELLHAIRATDINDDDETNIPSKQLRAALKILYDESLPQLNGDVANAKQAIVDSCQDISSSELVYNYSFRCVEYTYNGSTWNGFVDDFGGQYDGQQFNSAGAAAEVANIMNTAPYAGNTTQPTSPNSGDVYYDFNPPNNGAIQGSEVTEVSWTTYDSQTTVTTSGSGWNTNASSTRTNLADAMTSAIDDYANTSYLVADSDGAATTDKVYAGDDAAWSVLTTLQSTNPTKTYSDLCSATKDGEVSDLARAEIVLLAAKACADYDNEDKFKVSDAFDNLGKIRDGISATDAGDTVVYGNNSDGTLNILGINVTFFNVDSETHAVTMRDDDNDNEDDSDVFTFETIKQKIVRYSGDEKYISMVKLNGATDKTSDVVNLTGQDLFGYDIFDDQYSGNTQSGSAMLNELLAVYTKTNASDAHWLSSDGVTVADVAHATVTIAETTQGSRLQLYNSVSQMLDNQSDNITEDITNVSGTDIAKLATKLMEMTTLYNMALALGGRVLPQSLADYL